MITVTKSEVYKDLWEGKILAANEHNGSSKSLKVKRLGVYEVSKSSFDLNKVEVFNSIDEAIQFYNN